MMSKAKTGIRPWADDRFEEDFVAWQHWLRAEPAILSDCSCVFIERCSKESSLYELMCDLADGPGEDG